MMVINQNIIYATIININGGDQPEFISKRDLVEIPQICANELRGRTSIIRLTATPGPVCRPCSRTGFGHGLLRETVHRLTQSAGGNDNNNKKEAAIQSAHLVSDLKNK